MFEYIDFIRKSRNYASEVRFFDKSLRILTTCCTLFNAKQTQFSIIWHVSFGLFLNANTIYLCTNFILIINYEADFAPLNDVAGA